MFDIAWSELLLVAIIILIVVGPKDLPKVMRTVGGLIKKARGFSKQFTQGMDQLAREADLEEFREGAKKIQQLKSGQFIKDAIDPTNEIANNILDTGGQTAHSGAESTSASKPAKAKKARGKKSAGEAQ